MELYFLINAAKLPRRAPNDRKKTPVSKNKKSHQKFLSRKFTEALPEI